MIRSANVNTNFDNFRGHFIPIDTATATSSDLTHDLGAPTHRWMNIYSGVNVMTGQSTPASNPTTGQYKIYPKSDGLLYSLNSAGVEQSVAATGTLPTQQKFTTGSGTYMTPANVKYIKVKMTGGGGGGCGGGTSSATAGSSGTASTFGASLTAGAGAGGGQNAAPAIGGTNIYSGTGFQVPGGNGQAGCAGAPAGGINLAEAGGQGGCSFFGGNGGGGQNGGTGTAGAINSGSGGGGGGSGSSGGTAVWGGGGGAAGGFIDALIVSPSATYSYVVGTGGAGGNAGTSGGPGGAGAAGIIIVDEYY